MAVKEWIELKERINSHLQLRDPDFLDIGMATVLSCRLPSDPTWLLVCGPSSSGKTEVLRMFADGPITAQFTGFTENSLISGYIKKDHETGENIECSLLADLDERCLVIKDYSELSTKREEKRDKIEAILRDAYDGYVKRAFGGEAHHKSFKTRFSILAATTSAHEGIDTSVSKAFGQRFIYFRPRGIPFADREWFFNHCLDKGHDSKAWRKENEQGVLEFLVWVKDRIPSDITCDRTGLFFLCDLAAVARTPFIRDRFNKGAIIVAPEQEYGIRLGKQIYNLMRIARWLGGNPRRIMRRVAKSCIVPSARGDILEIVNTLGRCRIDDIVDNMRVSESTVRKHLEELKFLGLLDIQKAGKGKGLHQIFGIDARWKDRVSMMFDEDADDFDVETKMVTTKIEKKQEGRPRGKRVSVSNTLMATLDPSLLDWMDEL